MKHVKGPDFPTGCAILGLAGIKKYFETGRGSMKVRGKAGVEELKGNREQIVITEIPYNVNRATLVERIAELVNEKVLTDIIGDPRRIGREHPRGHRTEARWQPEGRHQQPLQAHRAGNSFSVNMLAIDHGRPKLLPLKEAIQATSSIGAKWFCAGRGSSCAKPRTARRSSKVTSSRWRIWMSSSASFATQRNRDEARVKLLAFEWTRPQVEKIGILIRNEARLVERPLCFHRAAGDPILDLRLYQLTGLERERIKSEYDALIETIKDLLDILAKESRVLKIITDELREIQKEVRSGAATQIVPDEGEINMEDLIANEGCIITITHNGFIKRTAVSAYRAQRRGGKGVIGMTAREGATEEDEGDFVEHLFTATTHDYLMFFTRTAAAYVERVYEIPEMGRASKGRSIANLLNCAATKKSPRPSASRARRRTGKGDETWNEKLHIVFATRSGIVKKSNLNDFQKHPEGRDHRHPDRARGPADRLQADDRLQRDRAHHPRGHEHSLQ